MEILGGLINLDIDNSLPIPWWHRAPIGLLDKTWAYIALVESENRDVGDFVLTVLEPNKWNNMLEIECMGKDEPGFISKVFNSILPFNISIAETATLETGKMHHITLITEPSSDRAIMNASEMKKLVARLKKTIEKLGSNMHPKMKSNIQPLFKLQNKIPKVLWHDIVQIEHGWINNFKWKKILEKHYKNFSDLIDVERIVISADTTRRLIRYVFPKKGSISIEIEHADRPGSMKMITDILAKCNSNVLSLLLRRGGAKPKNAVLVVVCEPLDTNDRNKFTTMIIQEFNKIDQKYRVKWKIRSGDNTKNMIYPRHPDEFVIKVPSKLIPDIKKYKLEIPPRKIPIFISRRFIEELRRDKIVKHLKDILDKNEFHPVEATPEAGELQTSLIQILSKMWIAKAGIILVSGGNKDGFSMNLAHEAGFLHGQGKPMLILVEEGSSESLDRWSNASGLVMPRFSNDDDAFNKTHSKSIESIITKWLNPIKEELIKKNKNDHVIDNY